VGRAVIDLDITKEGMISLDTTMGWGVFSTIFFTCVNT
jgi:hypothetical protein